MKRILVVGDSAFTANQTRNKDEFGDFLRKTLDDTAIVDTVSVDKIIFTIRKGEFEAVAYDEEINLRNYDAIYVRSLRRFAYHVSQFAKYHGITCINDYSIYYTGSKSAQAVVFLQAGVDFIPSYYAVNTAVLVQYMASTVGYPYILKANNGAQGNSNYLIRTQEDATKVLREEPNEDFIAQEFCPNDRDYRLLVVGDSTLLFQRQGQANTHLNNTSKGGVASPVSADLIPAHMIDEAKAICLTLGLTVAGFDLIPNIETGSVYFLEINSQPQLRTGALLEEKQKLIRNLFESI